MRDAVIFRDQNEARKLKIAGNMQMDIGFEEEETAA